MNESREPAAAFLSRLVEVRSRLAGHAGHASRGGLTDPDRQTGERWDWGQVWAHLAEFPGYWMEHVRRTAVAPGPDAVPFGRVKTDPGRIAAIEAGRGQPVPELMASLEGQLDELQALLGDLPQEAWRKRGVHATLGEMDLAQMVEEFLIGHLEEHEAQLHALEMG